VRGLSVAPIFEVHPGVVKFRIVPANAVVVELVTASMVNVKGKLYVDSRDLPANYWHEADTFKKVMSDTFEDAKLIVFTLSPSGRLYALVFFSRDDSTEIVAFDVREVLSQSGKL
jgi:hypothetical protein